MFGKKRKAIEKTSDDIVTFLGANGPSTLREIQVALDLLNTSRRYIIGFYALTMAYENERVDILVTRPQLPEDATPEECATHRFNVFHAIGEYARPNIYYVRHLDDGITQSPELAVNSVQVSEA